jgi:ActR/RegA family two-component response regulator
MKKEKRVLIVEDDRNLLSDYAEIVSAAGYTVDSTDNLSNALAMVSEKAFHVGIIDIQLDKDDEHNRDGLSVIEYLRELDEGTEVIILSGQPRLEIAIEAYEKYDISQYLQKGKRSPSDITNAVNRAYEKCRLHEFGKYSSISQYLSDQRDPTVWEHKCLTVLEPSGGIKGLHLLLSDLCKPYVPLLCKLDVLPPMQVDEERRLLTGEFWSKALGEPVLLQMWPKEVEADAQAGLAVRQLHRSFEKAGVVCNAFLFNANRADFKESN